LLELMSGIRSFGPLAQLVEQWTFNPLVAGSNPARPTKHFSNIPYIIPTPYLREIGIRGTLGSGKPGPTKENNIPKAISSMRWKSAFGAVSGLG
jgi:hypothetical protein